MIKLSVYSDQYFRYVRKHPHIASTWGKQESVLDLIQSDSYRHTNPDIAELYHCQTLYRDHHQEYGLCNRLDNRTSGLLYFARTPQVYDTYHQAQQQGHITKTYLVDITGKRYGASQVIAMYRITHHPDDTRKMIVSGYDSNPLHHTFFQVLYYDPITDRTTLIAQIHKWQRHQIRLHLFALGYTIVWEDLYLSSGYKKKYGTWPSYHLRCIWLRIYD